MNENDQNRGFESVPVAKTESRALAFVAQAVVFVRTLFYVPEMFAKEAGMTHHGTMFGVPAWVSEEEDGWQATPKANLLLPWVYVADASYFIATYFLPEGYFFQVPIKATKPIDMTDKDLW